MWQGQGGAGAQCLLPCPLPGAVHWGMQAACLPARTRARAHARTPAQPRPGATTQASAKYTHQEVVGLQVAMHKAGGLWELLHAVDLLPGMVGQHEDTPCHLLDQEGAAQQRAAQPMVPAAGGQQPAGGRAGVSGAWAAKGRGGRGWRQAASGKREQGGTASRGHAAVVRALEGACAAAAHAPASQATHPPTPSTPPRPPAHLSASSRPRWLKFWSTIICWELQKPTTRGRKGSGSFSSSSATTRSRVYSLRLCTFLTASWPWLPWKPAAGGGLGEGCVVGDACCCGGGWLVQG